MRANRRVLYALLLASVGGMGACDRTDGGGDLMAPTAQFSHTSHASANGIANGNANGASKQQLRILKSRSPLLRDSEILLGVTNKHGAIFTFGTNTLEVQKNSVKKPTFFAATIRAGEEIEIDLRAWENGTGNPVTQFSTPVRLTIDLSDIADTIEDWNKVVIVYHNPDGSLEVMPSTADRDAHTVTAILSHFSDYSPATGRTEPPPVLP